VWMTLDVVYRSAPSWKRSTVVSLKRWFSRDRHVNWVAHAFDRGHDRSIRAKQTSAGEDAAKIGTRISGIGGLLVFVGAVAFIVHIVVRSVLTAGIDPAVSAQARLWVPVNALGALGAVLVLLGLPAVYARIAGQGGLPGLVGLALIEASWMFFGLFLSL